MANNQTFKSIIVFEEDPLVNVRKTVRGSAIPYGTGTYKKIARLEVYTDNKKHCVEYLVLTCPTVFVQTRTDICLDI